MSVVDKLIDEINKNMVELTSYTIKAEYYSNQVTNDLSNVDILHKQYLLQKQHLSKNMKKPSRHNSLRPIRLTNSSRENSTRSIKSTSPKMRDVA